MYVCTHVCVYNSSIINFDLLTNSLKLVTVYGTSIGKSEAVVTYNLLYVLFPVGHIE